MGPKRHPIADPQTLEHQERERFDMEYGTNTTTPLAKSGFPALANLEHGKPYMASWTSEIEKSFDLVGELFGKRFGLYTFIDIGCGKGKVPIVWRLKARAAGLSPRILGIDYYPPFVEIARVNHQKVFGDPGEFLVCDATEMDYSALGPGLIAYLYNPFDAVVLDRVLCRLRTLPCILIYNIPTHADRVHGHGFTLLHERHGSHQNQSTTIYANHPLPA